MKALWLIYVPPSLRHKKILYSVHTVYLCIKNNSQNNVCFPKQHYTIGELKWKTSLFSVYYKPNYQVFLRSKKEIILRKPDPSGCDVESENKTFDRFT